MILSKKIKKNSKLTTKLKTERKNSCGIITSQSFIDELKIEIKR